MQIRISILRSPTLDSICPVLVAAPRAQRTAGIRSGERDITTQDIVSTAADPAENVQQFAIVPSKALSIDR